MISKRKRALVVLAVVGLLLLGITPAALAEIAAACAPGGSVFPDVPDGSVFCTNIVRIYNLGITTGYSDGTYRGNNNVTRYEMAAYIDRLTTATTNDNEPYIFSVNNQDNGGTFSGDGIVARSFDQNGLEGISYGAAWADYGVYGQTNSTASFDAGVYGNSSGAAMGVYGYSADGWGGYFRGNEDAITPDVVLGGESGGSADDGILASRLSLLNSDIVAFTNDEFHIHLDENDDEDGNFVVIDGANNQEFRVDENGNIWLGWEAIDTDAYFRGRDDIYVMVDATNDDTNPGYFSVVNHAGTIAMQVDENGNFSVSGTKSSVAETSAGDRLLYAVESPEVWFEDFGSAKLVDGAAVVEMDAMFLETVNTGLDYHVFLTPLGDCNGLYVTNRTATSFEVRELGGGTASIDFDFRIVAKRVGFEDVRLAPAPTHNVDGDGPQSPVPQPTDMGEDAPLPGVTASFEEVSGAEVR